MSPEAEQIARIEAVGAPSSVSLPWNEYKRLVYSRDRAELRVTELEAIKKELSTLALLRRKERDKARSLVDLGVALLTAADCPNAALELDRRRSWLKANGR